MKKSYLLTCIGIAMSLLGFSPTTHAQTYPYFCGFEDDAENAQWTLVNGSCANQWYIGTAAKHEGEKGLYVSNDGGATSGYDTYSTSTVYAYRTFEITEAGAYSFSFDCYVQGETSDWSGASDYAHAYLIPGDVTPQADNQSFWVTIPESYVSLTEDLVGQSGWETKAGFQNLDPGTYKLAFLWHNNDWSGSGAAMIDNVKIEKLTDEPNVSVATSLEFPLTEVGGSSTATLTVTNTGGGDMNISGITFSNPAFELVDAVTYPDVIPALNGEKTYNIRFTPTSEGEITGTMTIQSNAPETVVSLSGSSYTHIEITDEAPLFEDFNNLDESQPNLGLSPWTLKSGYYTSWDPSQWLVGTGTNFVCDGTSLQAMDAPSIATLLLISPKLYIPADRYAKISFYMLRSGINPKDLEGFKVYVNDVGDIYSYDSNGEVVVDGDVASTLVEPILHATRYVDGLLYEQMYQVEVNIPAEYSGKEFYVIFEAIQEYSSPNYIDNLKIELLPNTPLLESSTQSIDFGFVRAGDTASQELTLSNVGPETLTVSFSQKQANSPFSITPESASLDFNEQKTFTVNFSSSEVGQFSDDLFILTNSNNDTIALKAETYPTTSYYETFDAATSLPSEWVVARSSGQTNYSVAGEVGIDGSNAVSATHNSYYSPLDTLYSPVVSGKVTFDFKKLYLSSKMEAYIVAADGSKTTIDVATDATDWIPVVVDNVPEGSRIAFLMQNTYLDNFMAFAFQQINKGVQIVNSSLKPASETLLYAGDDRAEDNELQFTIKNIGIQPVEAGTYNFTTRLVDENGALPEGVSYKIYLDSDAGATLCEDNVIPGLALDVNEEKTISGYLHIDGEERLEKLAFLVTANKVENTHFAQMQTGNNITLLPNKGEASLSSVEFGLVNKSTTLDYTIENNSNNGALTVSGITVPEGSVFSVNAEFPLVIPNGESSTIQITFAAEPGHYTTTLTVEHDGIGDTEIPVSGTMLSPATLLESFEGQTIPPFLWNVMQGMWSRSTISPYDGQACIAVTSATPDTIVTPLLHLAAGDSIAFSVKASSSSSYQTEVLYSADGQNWTSLETISTYNSSSWSSWAQKAVYMPDGFVEGDYYLAFACQRTYLDMVYGPQVVYQDHNIYINGFEGETTGMVNYTQDFTIDLICLSSEGETSDSYTIDLMNGDEKIGSYNVEAMTLNESKSYTCSWTPRAAGEAHVYALITSNETVSSTDTITVNVAEETFITKVMIGDLSTPTSTTYNRHTVFETLYTPELLEGLNAGDVIGSIRLPYITDPAYYTWTVGFRINVWIGNTEKTELMTDKFSAADIEGLEHIGVDLKFEVGGSQDAPLYFEMTPETPITYEGGNLNLIVSVDSISYSFRNAAQFFLSEGAANSMKYCAFDAQVFDYEAAWAESYTPELRANIMAVELDLVADAPVVHGIVTQADSQEPIEGATVTMQSGEVIYTATTDAEGAYSIEVLQPGKEYAVSVVKDQYTAVEGVTLLVESGDNIEQNFALSIASGIDHTIEAATKIFTDRSGNIRIEAGSPINLVKVYSMSGSLCITESPATESAVINAGGLKGVYIVEVQTAGSVKRAKVRL